MLVTTILKHKIAPNNRLRSAFRVTFGVRNSISSDRQGQSPGGGRPRRRKCPTPAEDRLTPATLSCIKIYVVNHVRAVHFPRNALLLDRPTRVRNCYILPLFFVTMDVQPALGRAGARIKMHSTRGLVLACAFPVYWKMGVFSDYIGVS